MKNNMKIGFIGVGKLGLDCSEVIAEKYDVVGYDIKPFKSELVKTANSIGDVVQGRDIIFIAVPTPHDSMYGGERPTYDMIPKNFDYSIVVDVLKEVNKFATKEQLVVLISTTLPGTVRSKFIEHTTNYRFIYNPYLIAMGSVKWDMINPECLIIGTKDGDITGDAKLLVDFYKPLMKNSPAVNIGTWDEAEGIKIFYNTFISTKVALVNMIQDVAEKSGNMNVDVVTGALERSTYRILGPAYMKAGMGDGGGCHPRDNIALRYMAEKLNLNYDLFDAIMTARERQAQNLAKRLVIEANKADLPIVILGKAFKANVEYIDGSSSILTGHFCESFGERYKVTYDPITPIKAVYLLAHMGKHHDYSFPEGSVVVDPWRAFHTDKNISVVHYGNTRND
jgi:UDPglucose 6-dehydrogenase